MTALAIAPNGVKSPMLSNVLEEWFGNDFFNGKNVTTPKTNIIENDDSFLIELSVPGFKKKDLEINIDRKVLTISTVNEEKDDSKIDGVVIREFSQSSFTKSFRIPNVVDAEMIKASCNDGILRVTLPKKEEVKAKPPRKVTIK